MSERTWTDSETMLGYADINLAADFGYLTTSYGTVVLNGEDVVDSAIDELARGKQRKLAENIREESRYQQEADTRRVMSMLPLFLIGIPFVVCHSFGINASTLKISAFIIAVILLCLTLYSYPFGVVSAYKSPMTRYGELSESIKRWMEQGKALFIPHVAEEEESDRARRMKLVGGFLTGGPKHPSVIADVLPSRVKASQVEAFRLVANMKALTRVMKVSNSDELVEEARQARKQAQEALFSLPQRELTDGVVKSTPAPVHKEKPGHYYTADGHKVDLDFNGPRDETPTYAVDDEKESVARLREALDTTAQVLTKASVVMSL